MHFLHAGPVAVSIRRGLYGLPLKSPPAAHLNAHIALNESGLLDVTYVGHLRAPHGVALVEIELPTETTIGGTLCQHEELSAGGWFSFKPELIG